MDSSLLKALLLVNELYFNTSQTPCGVQSVVGFPLLFSGPKGLKICCNETVSAAVPFYFFAITNTDGITHAFVSRLNTSLINLSMAELALRLLVVDLLWMIEFGWVPQQLVL